MLSLAFSLVLALAQDAGPPPTPTPAATVDPRVEIERGLDLVRALVGKREWKRAAKSLGDLLKQFENSEIVRGKRIEIVDLTRLAAFWSKYPAPEPKDLIGGELERFDRTSDAITLKYPSGRFSSEFKARSNAKWKRPKITVPLLDGGSKSDGVPPFPDFDRTGLLNVHPLQWNGPYSVEIKARVHALNDSAPAIMFVLGDDDLILGTIGSECVLRHIEGSMERTLDKKGPAPFEVDRPYRLTAQVGEKSVTIQLNGKVLLTGPKTPGAFGWFGFANVRSVESIVMRGKSYGQWIDALVDAAAAADREAFDKRFKPREELPAWLFETARAIVVDSVAEAAAKELVEKGLAAARMDELRALVQERDVAKALAFVDGLPAEDITPVTRSWLRAAYLLDLDRLEEARMELAVVSVAAPKHRGTRRHQARLALRLDTAERALAEALQVVAEFPDDAPAREHLVTVLMQRGELDEAARVAERTVVDGINRKVSERLVKRTRRAIEGPTWRTSQELESKHFIVESDMDRDTCAQISRLLEESHGVYAKVLGPISAERPRMRAFVFSGKQGYTSYCADLTGDKRASTQGLFDPNAEQLLLWSAVDRNEFTNTARHEGFHQYLHALVPEVPTWLNEGLAQYFETMRKAGSAWVFGDVPGVAQSNLASLSRCPDLSVLFKVAPVTFYGDDAGIWYAYSWCVLHTLAHGTPEDREVFDDLLARLGRGEDGALTVREAFEGIDLAALFSRVKAHATQLAR